MLERQGTSLLGGVLAKGSHKRRFLGDEVKRIPVREGSIRATLFQPPGGVRVQRGRSKTRLVADLGQRKLDRQLSLVLLGTEIQRGKFSLRVAVARGVPFLTTRMLRICLSHCPRRTSIVNCGGWWSRRDQRARFSVSACLMEPRLSFSPPDHSLFDQPLAISVEGLRPEQEVGLRASLEDERGERFESRAFYRADGEGRLDLQRSPALEGGTFSGLEPMGLLWALQPLKPLRRLVKRDVERPFRLELEVLERQGESLSGGVLAKGFHDRRFLGDGVKRIPVREGSIRATLFQPPGKGPFPGIIHIPGTGGGIPESSACLMANHGFAILALAYYGYEDLPKDMKEFHLEYFEEAVNYMLKHPVVKGPGIGLLGHSKGGDLCISMASFLKGITAIVTVNGSIANFRRSANSARSSGILRQPSMWQRVMGRAWGFRLVFLRGPGHPLKRIIPKSYGRRGLVTLSVTPAVGLADRPAKMTIEGLAPLQGVTLRALVANGHGSLFDACAHYQADQQGGIDLSKDVSRGGDYVGLEPMGLFWSLSPATIEKPYQRLEPEDVESPVKVQITVHQEYSQPGAIPGQVLAQTIVERWFTLPGVRRIRLKEGAIRGSLFLPPGNGPFPGVIDMFGDEGGLIEFRSSLLATHGFAALSLPYFNFEDLPKVMDDFHLEYFEEAARFLLRHPKVKKPGIGVIGTGKGGELALSMMTFLPEVVAAVCISGCSSITATALHYGKQTLPGLCFNMSRIKILDNGVFDIYEALDDPRNPANSQSRIPIEKAEGHFLFVVGEDDHNWKSSFFQVSMRVDFACHSNQGWRR
ncbi:acyl-coenzyme A thioesterase 1-like [Crotalus adamanteus]|uniref:Acyl-coenzyme A thioesterase 1-like n=1 Tax=Crotalus adamanteus TaxID=8729 RepID=A0AAW1C5X2_CROAD